MPGNQDFPTVALPSPSTQRALDESADRARLNLAQLQTSRQNTNLILQGLGGLTNVARQHFTAIQQADDFLLADRAQTDLVTAAYQWENDLARSDNPELGLADYWEQWDSIVKEIGEGLTPGAQRAFMQYAGQVRRQRVPYVLQLAEARTGELVGERYNERADALVRAGNVEGMKALNAQFRQTGYLPASFTQRGGGADDLVTAAERIAVLPTIIEQARDYGAGTASTWALNPANTPNHDPDERLSLVRLADTYASAFEAQRTEQEARQLEQAYSVLNTAISEGRPLTPEQVGRVVRGAGFSGDTAATLTQRLVAGTGSQEYADHLQTRILGALDNALTLGLSPEETPSFLYAVNWARLNGYIDEDDASDYRKQAQGVIEPQRLVGDGYVKDFFQRMQLHLSALSLGLDPAESIQGTQLLDDKGQVINTGTLQGTMLTMVTEDGRPVQRSLAGIQQELLREFRKAYNAKVEAGQVPVDSTEIAGLVTDQWLRHIMPGVQMGEPVDAQGDPLYSGPYVFHPGSGISGAHLIDDFADELEKFEGKFEGPVTFQDAWERAGGDSLLKRTFEDGARVGAFGPKVIRGWFKDAWAVQSMMSEVPRSGVAAAAADPVYQQITGVDALAAAGVQLPPDIQEGLNSLMQEGRFHEAGQAAAQFLPADERVLNGLMDQGLLAGMKMVRGGAVVKLHPLTPWVPVPFTYDSPAAQTGVQVQSAVTPPPARVPQGTQGRPESLPWWMSGDLARPDGWRQGEVRGQGRGLPSSRAGALAVQAERAAQQEVGRLQARRQELAADGTPEQDLHHIDRAIEEANAQAARHRAEAQALAQQEPEPVWNQVPTTQPVFNRVPTTRPTFNRVPTTQPTFNQVQTTPNPWTRTQTRINPFTGRVETTINPWNEVQTEQAPPDPLDQELTQEFRDAMDFWVDQPRPTPAATATEPARPAHPQGAQPPGAAPQAPGQLQPAPPAQEPQRPAHPQGARPPGEAPRAPGQPQAAPAAGGEPGRPANPQAGQAPGQPAQPLSQPAAAGTATEPAQPPPPEGSPPPGEPPPPGQQPTGAPPAGQPQAPDAPAGPLDAERLPGEPSRPEQPPPDTMEPLPPPDLADADLVTEEWVTDEPIEMIEIGTDSAGTPIYAESDPAGSTWTQVPTTQPIWNQFQGTQPAFNRVPTTQPTFNRVPTAQPIFNRVATTVAAGGDGQIWNRVPTAEGPGQGQSGAPAQVPAPPGGITLDAFGQQSTMARPAPSVPTGTNRAGELVYDEPGMPQRPVMASRSPRGDGAVMAVPIAIRDGIPTYYMLGGKDAGAGEGAGTGRGGAGGRGTRPGRTPEPRGPSAPRRRGGRPGEPTEPGQPEGTEPTGEPGTPPAPGMDAGRPGELGHPSVPDGGLPTESGEPTAPGQPTGPGAARVQPDVPSAPTRMFAAHEASVPAPPGTSATAPPSPGTPGAPTAAGAAGEPIPPGAPAGPGQQPGQPGAPGVPGSVPGTGEPTAPGQPSGPGAPPIMPTQPSSPAPLYGPFHEGELVEVAQAMARAWSAGDDVPMIDEAIRYLALIGGDEVGSVIVDFAEQYTDPHMAAASTIEKEEIPTLARAAQMAPPPTQPRGGFLAREPMTEPGTPAPPGAVPQPGADPGAIGPIPFRKVRRRFEPRSSDIPGPPEPPVLGAGPGYRDRMALEPREPELAVSRTLDGQPWGLRQEAFPAPPHHPQGPGAARVQPDVHDRPTRMFAAHEPGIPDPADPAAVGAPPVVPWVPAAPRRWEQSPQEWMSYIVMANDVQARVEAQKAAVQGLFEDAPPADPMVVANAIASRSPWRQPPEAIQEMVEAALESEELEERDVIAMSAWHLNTAYPGWKWWEENPAATTESRPRRPLPQGQDFVRRSPQVVDLIRSQEGFRAEPYLDPGGGPWTIGYGQTQTYRRNSRGRVIEVGPVTEKTKSMTREQAEEQLALAVELHYDAMVREMPREALNWLSDSQLAALTAMTYNRGAGAMGSEDREYRIRSGDTLTQIAQREGVSYNRLLQANRIEDPDMIRAGDTLTIPAAPGSQELRQALMSQDLEAAGRVWFETFDTERALQHDYAQGLINRRAASALMMFHGYPSEGEVMDAGGWAQWKDAAVNDPRIASLRRGAAANGGALMRVGDPALEELVPANDMQWSMKLRGLDPKAAGERWVWVTPRGGDLPAHYQPWKKDVRQVGDYLVFLIEAPQAT